MTLIKWEDRFLVGIHDVDKHAKQFISLLNLLRREFTCGLFNDSRASLLNTLASLSRFHFEYEERLMREMEFPKYSEHKCDHDAFLARLREIPSPTPDEQVELLEFLREWAQRHFDCVHPELRREAAGRFPR